MSLAGVKAIIKNPKVLFPILGARGYLNWMSDETYIKISYALKMGRKLNLNNPTTYNEKLQWLKLHDRKPIYTTMVDKYAAKQYVADLIGEEYIIPTLGVWESFDEIDFDALPNQFVLKCTHDSGGLVICRDKATLDKKAARQKLEASLKRNYYRQAREWPYKNVKPRILAEKYMESGNDKDLIDYKFYCFDGEPKFLYISHGLSNHSTAHISYASLDWKKQPFKRKDFADFEELPPKPVNFDRMVALARQLSVNTSFLRVDFYEIGGYVYFSELTFFPGGGITAFDPPEWDYTIGSWLQLPETESTPNHK